MDTKFGYRGAEIPHSNHLAELGFSMIGARGRDLMYHTNVKKIRYIVYKEVYRTAAMFDVLTVISIYWKQAIRYDQFCGSNSSFSTKLSTWGENRSLYTPKISDRGTVCMIV